MKTKEEILKQADQYVGHPAETDESLDAYSTRRAFIDGAEWMQKRIIDKACEWWTEYLDYPTHTQEDRDRIKEMVSDYRKAMEGTK